MMRGPVADGGGPSLAITFETDGMLEPAWSIPLGPLSVGRDDRTACPH